MAARKVCPKATATNDCLITPRGPTAAASGVDSASNKFNDETVTSSGASNENVTSSGASNENVTSSGAGN